MHAGNTLARGAATNLCNKTKVILFDTSENEYTQFKVLQALNDRALHDSGLVMCCDIVHRLVLEYLIIEYTIWDERACGGGGGIELVATCAIRKGAAGNRDGCSNITYKHAWQLLTEALSKQLQEETNDPTASWIWNFQVWSGTLPFFVVPAGVSCVAFDSLVRLQGYNFDAEEAGWKGLREFMVSNNPQLYSVGDPGGLGRAHLCVTVSNGGKLEVRTAEILDIFHVTHNGKSTAHLMFPHAEQVPLKLAVQRLWKKMLNTRFVKQWKEAWVALEKLGQLSSPDGRAAMHGMTTFYHRRYYATYACFMPASNLHGSNRSTMCELWPPVPGLFYFSVMILPEPHRHPKPASWESYLWIIIIYAFVIRKMHAR